MSYADQVFVHNCTEILTNGISDVGMDVRPRWEDGAPAHTIKRLYVSNQYDLRKEFPVMTLRKTYFKSAMQEIFWIYRDKTSQLKYLQSHIWDAWDVGNGSIGKAYGYQINLRSKHHIWFKGDTERMRSLMLDYYVDDEDWVWLNQMDAVQYDLAYNPASRAILTNTYNHEDLTEMGLRPCAFMMQYSVTVEDGEKVLNGCLTQRSQDTLTANNWNVAQYAGLLSIVAHCLGMKPGRFAHNVWDMHIYDRHTDIVRSMIQTYTDALQHYYAMHPPIDDENFSLYDVPYPAPKLWINPDKHIFNQFTDEDIKLVDYQCCPFDYKIEVAI